MLLKILFLSHKFYPDIGGIEANSEALANYFSEAGHQVRVMTWSGDSTGKSFPFAIIRNPSKRMLFKQHAWADIIFENNPCLQMSWPGLFFRRPSVIALHTWVGGIHGTLRLQDRIKHIWLKRAGKIIAVSAALQKLCWPEAIVIGNPYNAEVFKSFPDIQTRNEFVFLGRLVSDKGADLAIKAIDMLRNKSIQKKPNTRYALTIIGDGPERNALEKLTADLKLRDYIYFKGSLSGADLAKTLNQHRYLLVPSRWEEPFGIVALEGMACGCLPIVSDGGGLPDAIGNAGITFRRGDVNDLFNRINEILDKPELELQLRHAAPEHLAKHHTGVIARKFLDVLEAQFKN